MKTLFRLLAAVAVSGALGFGAVQALAIDDTPDAVGCRSFACRTECAPFGGDLGPGGPGKPLTCYCCG